MPEENMTERAILAHVQENAAMLEKIYRSAEKTRRMFLWTLIISLAAVVLPLIGLALVIPYVLSMLGSALTGAGLGL